MGNAIIVMQEKASLQAGARYKGGHDESRVIPSQNDKSDLQATSSHKLRAALIAGPQSPNKR
jgi:hypothetical protein